MATINGTSGNDTLNGTSGDDTINGLGGQDTLSGGGGNDTLDGGEGSDALSGGAGDDQLYGGTGNGPLSGYDTLTGGGGNDTFKFATGDGEDTITDFSAGDTLEIFNYDTADFTQALNGVVIWFAPGEEIWLPNTDVATVQADISYNPVNDSIAGGPGDDGLFGYSGNDNIAGGGGSDSIYGGTGDDILSGGPGNDFLTGDAGNDIFEFGRNDGQDGITDFTAGDTLQVSYYRAAQSITQLGADVLVVFSAYDQIYLMGTDVATVQAGLHSIAPPPITLNGTSRADILTGGAGNDTLNGLGGNDRLNGGTGSDIMKGGAGNDIYYVDDADDKVIELSGQGTDTVHSTVSYTLGANVENGMVDGPSSAALIGNGLANSLTGSSGDDFLYGLAGGDKLIGGGGNDFLRGGPGADTLTGGLGADTFIFETGGGNDKVTDFVSGTDSIDLSLIAGVTSADLKIAASRSGTVISVDADHNGRADFTITLAGVSHVGIGDFIFA